ncbi:MAG: MFS transporter [Alphaproteobacteria bacterium]|nr:MFS transporter [Alphaproteobacteria bacterium]
MSMQQGGKISVVEKIGYGFGDGASNLIWMTFIYFQLNFYTDVYGLAAGALATMLLITRTWDMFIDVIIGMTADRTKTRWGKFRPYLLWLAVPFGVIAVLTFTTPSFSDHGKLIYAYVTLSLMMVVYSGINIPYGALMGVLSADSQERTSLASWRFSFAFGAGLFVQYFTLKLVTLFGHGNQQVGYQLAIGLYAALAVAMFLVTFVTTRERVQPMQVKQTSTGRDLLDLVTNVPWLVLCLLGIAQVCFVAIRGAAVIYYFKYYIGNVDAAPLFLLVGALMSLAGTFLIQYVTPYTGRKNAFIGLMLVSAADLVASYWVKPDQMGLLYFYNIVYCLLTGPTSALLWAMFADAADYSEWKTGRRATGLVFSASGMSNKFGWVIGGALSATLLAVTGFHANVVQTEHAQEGIRILMALAPAIGTIVCGLGMAAYTLSEAKMKTIHAELAARRAQQGA